MMQTLPMLVRVVPYSETWPNDYAAVRGQLLGVFGEGAVQIEHIGSTSVPGLCAKPVIDVLVGAESLEGIDATIPRLAAAGYAYVPKYEVELPMRRYFVRPESGGPRVHVHAVCRGSEIWNGHIAFRDALRADASVRSTYAQLKLELAAAHANDKLSYTEAKAPFIRHVLASLFNLRLSRASAGEAAPGTGGN